MSSPSCFVAWLELEAAEVFRQQNRQRQHRDVDISFDETDVVAGALLDDALGMRLGRSGRIHKQVHQALAAIAHRLAIDLEHIAKLQPAIPALRLDHQQIGFQFAMNGLRPRGRRCAAPEIAVILRVGLLGDDS
jgi:hypothetical protein